MVHEWLFPGEGGYDPHHRSGYAVYGASGGVTHFPRVRDRGYGSETYEGVPRDRLNVPKVVPADDTAPKAGAETKPPVVKEAPTPGDVGVSEALPLPLPPGVTYAQVALAAAYRLAGYRV